MYEIITKNIKIIIAFIFGLLVSGIGAFALNISSNDISYNNTTVGAALNDLYTKADNCLRVNTATLIVNTTESTTSFSFTPSPEYKFYIITDLYYSASANYSTWINYINIDNISNATYIDVGLTGRDSALSSGAARSFLVIPDGSGNDINISFGNKTDGVSVYGIK